MVGFSGEALVPQALVSRATDVIERYSLVEAQEPIIVALSGGKDSLLLCLVLRELGLDYRPLVVDMGYESGWGARVEETARSLGLDPAVVSVRDQEKIIAPSARTFLARNLEVLDSAASDMAFTPCSYCYNAKAVALEVFAERSEVRKIAFGHHQTDACASLIKEALMHIDCWDREHSSYSRDNFVALVTELRAEVCRFAEADPDAGPVDAPLLTRISSLVEEGKVDSDEPPRQPLRDNSGIEIIRPLFEISERDIIALRDELELPTEPSGCGHGATLETETPRELVHRAILREARSERLEFHLREVLLKSIARDGSGKVRARQRREALLGLEYKPAAEGLQKL